MKRFEGKVAIVAGGATGIGAATAQRLAGEGAAVAIGDVNVPGATDVAKAIEAEGGRALAVEMDLTDWGVSCKSGVRISESDSSLARTQEDGAHLAVRRRRGRSQRRIWPERRAP